jgi:hypothetical protein
MNKGDKVLARFPSGWAVGGTVLMIISPKGNEITEIDVLFLDGCHQAFPVQSVTPIP